VFLGGVTVALTGRVMSLRTAGTKLIFINLHGDEHKIQVLPTLLTPRRIRSASRSIKRADIIKVEGNLEEPRLASCP
jgi:lysyl-tRNA synthetase class II